MNIIVIGVDPANSSAKKLSAAISAPDGSNLHLRVKALPADRFDRLHVAGVWLRDLVREFSGPDTEVLVFLEESIVYGSKASTVALGMMNGALLLGAKLGRPRYVTLVNNSTWKKQVVGNGRAQKPDIRRHLRDHWRKAYTLAMGDQDLMDALCINRYGSGVVNRLPKSKPTVTKLRAKRR